MTSTSTVGLPRESRISRPRMLTMSLIAAQRSGRRDPPRRFRDIGSSGRGPTRPVGQEVVPAGHGGRAEASAMIGNSAVGSPKYNISSGALASTLMM